MPAACPTLRGAGRSSLCCLRCWSAPARRPLKVSFATDSAVSAPLWIARDAGLFEKYGLDAEVTYIRGGATNTQAIIAGSVDMSFSGSVPTITANLAGADMRF